jgi:alkane 1-monooxygenase
MRLRTFKYLSPFLLYYGALISFLNSGLVVWFPFIYAFFVIPLIELFMKGNEQNLSAAEEELAKNDRMYDVLLYLVVPLQYLALFLFLYKVSFQPHGALDLAGKTVVMGLLCGVMGINVGHELGHRVHKGEQFLAKSLLLTSLYMHFFIEHNKGHHKRVATPQDPSSARYGESLYVFYFRTIVFSYFSAWKIAGRDTEKKGHKRISIFNEMLRFQIIQAAFLGCIFYFLGLTALLLFCAAALMGVLLLETVNYIEHYGLQRKIIAEGKYERALPHHSWNSNHVIGRVMLFELSRHSDHHFLASRKYQVLRHHEDSPQMPTGYPGMMLLALVPPAWFKIMNSRVKKIMPAGGEPV